ncbi:paraquat-inducible protein A [Glaciecola sp. MF2-115]|uniref:paraquat-inducible protein A n=1 Tax=Glaciecola sp. MF2-115 TaxID=3384827 RepID=UPI0039A087E6
MQISFSLLLTAALLYIPANIYPIMSTELLGDKTESTIIGGVILFIEHESYFIAAVIFIASIIVPIAKMFALALLCYSASRADRIKQYELTNLYRITEFIGKWSMVDVFVVAILVALIQLGGVMSIEAGIAATAFAAVVILTMISAHQFDTRLLWDRVDEE